MTSSARRPSEPASNPQEHQGPSALPPGTASGARNDSDANPQVSLPPETREAGNREQPPAPRGGDAPQDGSATRLPGGATARREPPPGRRKDGPSARECSPADTLVAIATGGDAVLFTDQFGEPHAHVRVTDGWRTCKLRGQEFREWLGQRLWAAEGRACGSEAVSAAVNTLAGRARYHGGRIALETRLARSGDVIWYDLSDARGRAVRVTAEGWEVVERPPILFRRFQHPLPQVEPARGRPLEEFLRFANLARPRCGVLLLAYLVTCFLPDIPHPVAVFHGPQGAAKSTLVKMLRRLIDPSSLEVLSLGSAEQLPQALFHHWFVPFDNVAGVSPDISNLLCRAVTGDGVARRRLYSDDEDVIYHFRRCLCLNGINPAVEKPDLLDRSLLFAVERIAEPDRREEALVLKEFESLRAELLGAVFDALSGALGGYPTVRLAALPRMADFARWGAAVAETVGPGADAFILAYEENLREQHEEAIAGSPLGLAVVNLVAACGQWQGTPSHLLRDLLKMTGSARGGGGLPARPNALTRQLNVMKASLAQAGIDIDMTRRHGGRRWVVLRRGTGAAPAGEPGPGGGAATGGGPSPQGDGPPAPPPRLAAAEKAAGGGYDGGPSAGGAARHRAGNAAAPPEDSCPPAVPPSAS